MATVIKSTIRQEAPSGPSVRPIAFRFDDIAESAESYLDKVRDEAAKIIQQAHQEAESVKQKAAEAGRAAAESAIEELLDTKVAKQMQTIQPALNQAVKDIVDSKHAWQKHAEQTVVTLATTIASKIIRREVTNDPEITLNWIQEALTLAAGSQEMVLYLNPKDYKNLGLRIDHLVKSFSRLSPAKVISDESISPGSCRVLTEFGEVDLQIESQLARISEELLS